MGLLLPLPLMLPPPVPLPPLPALEEDEPVADPEDLRPETNRVCESSARSCASISLSMDQREPAGTREEMPRPVEAAEEPEEEDDDEAPGIVLRDSTRFRLGACDAAPAEEPDCAAAVAAPPAAAAVAAASAPPFSTPAGAPEGAGACPRPERLRSSPMQSSTIAGIQRENTSALRAGAGISAGSRLCTSKPAGPAISAMSSEDS